MVTSYLIALVFACLAFVSGSPSSFREDRATFYFTNPSQSSCSADDGREGYCLIQGCRVNQLKYRGRCGFGLASCCVAEQSCLKTTNVNSTYFVNPGYPKPTTSLGRCELTVKRRTADICQIRLDFIDFVLEQPDENGYCLNDLFSVRGAQNPVPNLCGNNTGQHLYFDVDPLNHEDPIYLTVSIKDITLLKRTWNIKVSHITCSSQQKAPSGCLQYYFGAKGEVRSFNFGTETKGTRQLANTEYSACVRQEQDHCSIAWKTNEAEGEKVFTLSGNVTAAEEGQLLLRELFDKPCDGEKDFVLISDGVDQSGQRSERHCGLAFPGTIETSFKPYVLRVFTGPTEIGDVKNTGFSLVYSQNKCKENTKK